MQFKMAENSLFAVLTRSPWWYSVMVALALIFLVQFGLGSQYVIFGFAGALPFLVIAVLAVRRQMKVPGQKQIEQTIESVSQLSAKEFTARLGQAYGAQNYEVEAFKGAAADLQLTQGWRVKLVASKRFKAARIGIEPLRAMVEAGRESEATGLIYAGLGELSENARKFATDNNIEILDAPGLAALLKSR